ncbi:hypothetical protein EON80_06885, partial [bacterium]
MIDFHQARQIALEKIGPDCGLQEDQTLEKPYGWYFSYQSRAYLESGDWEHMLVGSGGFIVGREEGRVFEFGSLHPLERNLKTYEAGFKFERYDLTITAISNRERTIQLLSQVGMTIVIPEPDGDTIWKIPRSLTAAQIKAALKALPCTFADHK